MSLIFGTFCNMMEWLPVSVARKVAAVERRMLEEDIANGREEPAGDVASVLTFCRFIESGVEAELARFADLPLEHWASYGKIVRKLVAAGELPETVQRRFEETFAKTSGNVWVEPR